ncbi:MAG: hypothetical protein QOI17_1186 [Gaiellales bacterium]|nr:hypothetical protein [Gaiellales bacterium]
MHLRPVPRSILVGLTAAAVTGCSGNDTSASSGPGGVTVSGSVATTPAPPLVPKRLVQYCGHAPACDDFASPTGNIRCFATAGFGRYVECDIASGLRPPQAKGSCDLDQPGLVVKATGVAAPDCRGDPTPAGLDDKIPALPYGQIWSRFGLSCTSRITGITCRNGDGHGFFLSRERWALL